MKKIVIHSGFHPEHPRTYNGEHIYKVIKERGNTPFSDYLTGQTKEVIEADKENTEKQKGKTERVGISGSPVQDVFTLYQLESNVWIKDLGRDRYVTDWTNEERWGRVEELDIDDDGEVVGSKDLGFMILRVDRERGLL